MASDKQTGRRQKTLSVDLGAKLLGQVEEIRREIQDALGSSITVSRGDVVRLALRRLRLQVLAHRAEVSGQCVPHHIDWMETAQEIQLDARCPDWLVPGPAERPPVKSEKKKGGKK